MAERYDPAGKTVLITGAARGIGAESARQLARRGARLALVGLEPERLAELAAELGGDAAWWEADVRDRDALTTAVDDAAARFGGIDIVIANAGIGPHGTLETIDPAVFEATVDINLKGVFNTLRAAVPHLKASRGYALTVASMAAVTHAPMLGHYSASKAGAEALSNAFRLEMATEGVDVGVAYFFFIDTDMVREGMASAPGRAWFERMGGPLGRIHPVEKVGRAVADGVERRARRVVVPGWARVLIPLRGLVEPLVGAGYRRRRGHEVVELANREAREGETPSVAPLSHRR